MNYRAIANKFRNTIVCIDSYQNRIMKGRLYNPYKEGGVAFQSTMDFIRIVEGMLNEMDYPQANELKRAFFDLQDEGNIVESCFPAEEGKIATFDMKILFRQNASWQGSVCWLNRDREESFRSVLELLLLMDSALQR